MPNGAFGRKTLLVIDDNTDDIEIVRIALEGLGCRIDLHEALNGETALSMLRNGRFCPDIVFLDLKLPGMSGINVLAEIRADEKLKNLPVFVSSSSVLEIDRNEAMAAGATGYIQKSFSMDEFIKDIEVALSSQLA